MSNSPLHFLEPGSTWGKSFYLVLAIEMVHRNVFCFVAIIIFVLLMRSDALESAPL